MRFYGGQPVDMGNAGALQAQSPLYTTPLYPVWGGGPLVPGDVPGRESFLGPAPKQRYKMSAGVDGIGNVGGLVSQAYPMVGDTINMGPGEYDYSNMPVIPDAQEEQYQREMMMDEFRNRAFPRPQQEYANPGQYFAQSTPLIGIGGKTVS
jgi:hypothetical protein